MSESAATGQRMRGQCLCGTVSFEVDVPERTYSVCHCGMCRRWSGGPLMSVHCPEPRTEWLNDEGLTELRRDRVGFVFQFFNLLPTLTLAENIALPLLLAGVPRGAGLARAEEGARRVGLAHRLEHYPTRVSGGELQRAALARALVHRPALVIADEPTGNLDTDNGGRVLSLLRDLNRETGVAVLLATHDQTLAAAADRVLHLRDGFEDGRPAVRVPAPALIET